MDPERKSVCGVYMSCVDPKRKSFKVTESMCHEWLTKQEVLKFRCLYNICGFPAERKSFKVTEPVYVSCVAHQTRRIEVSVSVCHVWIPKESFKSVTEFMHVSCVAHRKQDVLKFRCLYVMCGSRRKKFQSYGVYDVSWAAE